MQTRILLLTNMWNQGLNCIWKPSLWGKLTLTMFKSDANIKLMAQSCLSLDLLEPLFLQCKALGCSMKARPLSHASRPLPQVGCDVTSTAAAPAGSITANKLAVVWDGEGSRKFLGRGMMGEEVDPSRLVCPRILSPLFKPIPFHASDLCQLYGCCRTEKTLRPPGGFLITPPPFHAVFDLLAQLHCRSGGVRIEL